MLSEISWTEKDKCHMILLICGIWKQNKQANKTKQKHTHRQRWLSEGNGGLAEKGKGIKKEKFPVIK